MNHFKTIQLGIILDHYRQLPDTISSDRWQIVEAIKQKLAQENQDCLIQKELKHGKRFYIMEYESIIKIGFPNVFIKFCERSKSSREALRGSSYKLIRFLQRMCNLVKQFQSIYLSSKDSLELFVKLNGNNLKMFSYIGNFVDHRYMSTIIIENQIEFYCSCSNLTEFESRHECASKVIDFLAILAKINVQKKLLTEKSKTSYMIMDSNLSRMIYEATLLKWKNLCSNLPEDLNRFKVLAAFIATSDTDPTYIRVLSIGTGSKCIHSISRSQTKTGDCVLDSHAEIIARRAFKLLLYENVQSLLNNDKSELILERIEHCSNKCFRLKKNLKIHLYISSPPCGDARMFQFDHKYNRKNDQSRSILRVKMENCKEIIPSNFVRTNNRTVLMSCSDKVASWNVLGLQGSLLSCFIEPIFLNGLVVTSLFNLENIANALYDRIDLQSLRSLMPIANVNRHKIGYYRPKVVESIFKSSLPKESFISHNWFDGKNKTCTEVLNAQTGLQINGRMSRLSKRFMFNQFHDLKNTPNEINEEIKCYPEKYRLIKDALIETFHHSGLGQWIRKNDEIDFIE